MSRLVVLTSFVSFALAAGCSKPVDHQSAVKVMSSALTGTLAADGKVVAVDWQPSGGHIDATVTNIGGGSAAVTGTWAHNGSVTSTKVDITFQNWTDALNHVTLNGQLHEVGTFSSAVPLAGDVQLSGDLAATGDVVATVDFDLHANYSLSGVTVTGDVGGNSMSGGVTISAH